MRILLALIVGCAAIAVVMAWRRGSSKPDTPRVCLGRYYDGLQAGDLDGFTNCLAEPLKTKARLEFADPASLRRQAVKSWICVTPEEPNERETRLEVDEVRETGVRRVRFRLERTDRGWLITAITPLEDKPSSIPYGKDIRDP